MIKTTRELKGKIFNLLLILTSFIGYLEWGQNNKLFLIQAEGEIISKLFTDPGSVLHPFTLLPLAGQILLFITLFQRRPGKWLTFAGMAGMGILLAFMFVIGLLSVKINIVLSTLPFLIVAFLTVRYHRAAASNRAE